MSTILWRIRHPLAAWRHWRAMRRWERMFGPFGKAPF